MRIVVDVNESRSGLPRLLAELWADVVVRRLRVGDVAIGGRLLVERKTTEDLLASLRDGRLFRQAASLASSASRPVLIQEGEPDELARQIPRGTYRGVILALSVGFRIPVLTTRDLGETAGLLQHMAAQESRRESRRRRTRAREQPQKASHQGPRRLGPDAFELLLALPRVGPTRAAALAARLESFGDIAGLGIRDLLRVPGIGPDTAARIIDTVRGQGR